MKQKKYYNFFFQNESLNFRPIRSFEKICDKKREKRTNSLKYKSTQLCFCLFCLNFSNLKKNRSDIQL